ncbi:Potassium channel [Orbilia brochopaga]|uniref:Potassium channel n=1 Tax=Orbilia brochopaga TaxID=3140254 RepID=A0AAV9V580_9PEZI
MHLLHVAHRNMPHMHKQRQHHNRNRGQPSTSFSAATNPNEMSGNDPDEANEKLNGSGPEEDDNDLAIARLEAYADEFVDTGEPPIKWWFAAKGIPLVAATIGPLANLTSVAALVSPWRANLPTKGENAYDERFGTPFLDPSWVIGINAGSLFFGVIGNFFLMCNYSRRLRYVIAMPFTILGWFLSSGMLASIMIATHVYHKPISPYQVYTQAFWFGVISCGLYFFAASLLVVNIAGYFRRKYPDHIDASKAELSLMMHTVFFFMWIGIGALVFCNVQHWTYSDSIYFCNVTLLTIGFGDFSTTSTLARALVFPFSVVGITMLGLIVNNIHGFVVEIGEKDVAGKHIEHRRKSVATRAVANSTELCRQDPSLAEFLHRNGSGQGNGSINPDGYQLKHSSSIRSIPQTVIAIVTGRRRSKPVLLRASRDRFEAMRKIQRQTLKFKRWTALLSALIAVLTLWLLGALVFMTVEREIQHMTYFEAVYFCYVCLLTIGYGDLSPKSNAGKAFFLLWSICSVPTITILISSMGSTVIEQFQQQSERVAKYTILPKKGIRIRMKEIAAGVTDNVADVAVGVKDTVTDVAFGVKDTVTGVAVGMKDIVTGVFTDVRSNTSQAGDSEDTTSRPSLTPTTASLGRRSTAASGRPTLRRIREEGEDLESQRQGDNDGESEDDEPRNPLPQDYTFQELLLALTSAIRHVGRDVARHPRRAYLYDDWVEFTRLIRACEIVKPSRLKGVKPGEEISEDQIDSDEGFVLWDWIGEDSPLLHEGKEPAWVHDRLTKGLEALVIDHLQDISLAPDPEERSDEDGDGIEIKRV